MEKMGNDLQLNETLAFQHWGSLCKKDWGVKYPKLMLRLYMYRQG